MKLVVTEPDNINKIDKIKSREQLNQPFIEKEAKKFEKLDTSKDNSPLIEKETETESSINETKLKNEFYNKKKSDEKMQVVEQEEIKVVDPEPKPPVIFSSISALEVAEYSLVEINVHVFSNSKPQGIFY